MTEPMVRDMHSMPQQDAAYRVVIAHAKALQDTLQAYATTLPDSAPHIMKVAGQIIALMRAITPRQCQATYNGKSCEKWFVGRPDKLYCSPGCQNRGAIQQFRRRKKHLAAL